MTEEAQQETKKCPACGETVLAEARKCRHCHADLQMYDPAFQRRRRRIQAVAVLLAIAATGGVLGWGPLTDWLLRKRIEQESEAVRHACIESWPAASNEVTAAGFATCVDLATTVRSECLKAMEGQLSGFAGCEEFRRMKELVGWRRGLQLTREKVFHCAQALNQVAINHFRGEPVGKAYEAVGTRLWSEMKLEWPKTQTTE